MCPLHLVIKLFYFLLIHGNIVHGNRACILNNKDYAGNDIDIIPNFEGGLEACRRRCDGSPMCTVVLLRDSTCYLKDRTNVLKNLPGKLGFKYCGKFGDRCSWWILGQI